MRARVTTISSVLLTLLVGCRTAAPPPQPHGAPTELAERPVPLGSSSPGSASSPTSTERGSPTATPGGSTATASESPANGSPPRRFRTVGTAADRTGDAGVVAPAYADLVAIRIQDDGRSARVSVTFGADLPDPMPAGEQETAGVDLYGQAGERESDYQLLAVGDEGGWLAYLSAPQGFVRYEGTFELGGRRIVFLVPWSSLGDLKGAAFSGFLDWDRDRPIVNEVGEDHVPDDGTAPFRR